MALQNCSNVGLVLYDATIRICLTSTNRTTRSYYTDNHIMATRLLFVAFTLNSVISQLILRRGMQGLRVPQKLSGLPSFVADAAHSPWIYASVILQIVSYLMWMVIVSREKLGVAAATVGAGYYA